MRSRFVLFAVFVALLAALVVAPLADGNRLRTHDAGVSIQAKPATNVTPATTTLSASFTFGCSGFAYAYWKITLAGQGGGPDGSASTFRVRRGPRRSRSRFRTSTRVTASTTTSAATRAVTTSRRRRTT